jgi:hypothetical protein
MKTFTSLLFMAGLLSFLTGCVTGSNSNGNGNAAMTPQKVWQKAKAVAGAEKLDHPRALAADDNFLYFVTGATVAGQQEGTNNLMKMPLGGGAPTVLFKGGESIPTDSMIALDDTFVYFIADGLRRIPKTGGDAAILVKGVNVWDIAVDNESIYWRPFVGEGTPPKPIYSMPKSGGEPKTITGPQMADGLAVDDKFVYWTQPDGVYKVVKSGGDVEKIHSTPSGETSIGLKMDGYSFYFLSGRSKRNLMQMPKAGGGAKQFAAEVDMFWLGGMEVVYLRRSGVSESRLFKLAKAGGSETELDRGGFAADLVVGKNTIYISDVDKILELEK